MSFADDFTFDDFNELAQADASQSRDILERRYMPAVRKLLRQLMADGRITSVAGSGGRRHQLATLWNTLAVGGDGSPAAERAVNDAIEHVAQILLEWPAFWSASRGAATDEPCRARHATLVRLISSGTTDDLDWRVDSDRDYVTGESCRFELDGWRARLTKFDRASGGFVACADVAPPAATVTEITVPTGRLIVTDFLRCGAFDSSVTFDRDREYGACSLNSLAGQTRRTLAHAAEHNIAYTQTDNTVVGVHVSTDRKRVLITPPWATNAEANDDAELRLPGFDFAGEVSCDIWRVMAMDETVAAALAGEAEYAAYRKSDDVYAGNVVDAQIEPGRWRLACGETFEKSSAEPLGLPAGTFAWMSLEFVSPSI